MRRRLAAALVGLTTAAGALSVAAPASAHARVEQPDSCTIVTDIELEAAAGYPLEQGEEVVSSTKASGCGFQAATASDGPDIGVLVTNTATGNAKQTFSVKLLERGFGKSKKVSGVGKRAYFSFKKGKVPQGALLVLDGTDGVLVSLRGATTRSEALAETQAIATLVLGKLA